MSMSRGGGRGSRGGGFGHNGHNAARGPTLPWSLQQQVGGGGPQTGGGRGGRGGGRGGRGGRGGGSSGGTPVFSHRPAKRKEQRKAARQEKKHHRFEVQQQHAQQRHASSQQQQQQAAGTKRRAGDAAGAENPAKRQRQAPQPAQKQQPQQPQQQQPKAKQQQPARLKDASKPAAAAGKARDHSSSGGGVDGMAGSKKTMFYDLLAEQGVVAPVKGAAAAAGPGSSLQAAFLQDLRMERELARKLKVKKGSKRSGPEDGLDDLLSGITQLLPDSLKRAAAADAAAAGSEDGSEGADDEQQQQHNSGGGSDSEGGSDLSDPFGFGGSGDESSEEGDDSEGLGFGREDGSSEEGGDDMMQQDDDSSQGGEGFGLGSSSEEGSEGSGFDSGSEFGEEEEEGDSNGEDSDGSGSGSDEDAQLERQAVRKQRRHRQAAAGSDSDSEEHAEQQQPVAAGAAVASAAKYVPPALRRAQEAAAAAAGAGAGGGDSSSSRLPLAVQRRITGLLNRLAEANLQGIVRDIIGVYETEGRRAVAEAVSAGLLGAVAEGPRATEQFAAVVAVFVAGLTASARAQDISARFLEQLVRRLEQAYAAADGLACHNLIMLLAYCYSAGLVAADCMYSVLGELTRRFTESDVAMMLTLLNAVGLQLRSADPAAMKDFVLAVHGRAASAGASGGMSKRAEIMLELVMDIKNNRLREGKASKAAAAAAAAAGKKGRGGAAAVLQPGLLKWLKQLGVDDVTLSNISWAKLVQPEKKGMWWHPAATDAAAGLLPGVVADTLGGTSAAAVAAAAAAASAADVEEGVLPAAGGADGQAGGAVGAGQLLQLAAGLRMTTDVRRAVFVAIMGSEDCAEACEKLLRLPLKGDQSREVVRVLVECCLQEARYNPYYGHLAARLAAVSKGYKVTLQYCLWDQWKTVTSTEPRRLLCLAGLVGQLLASCVLPLSSLKPIDFDAAGSWTSKETFLWRHTLQLLLSGFASDAECEAAFARLAAQQPLGALAKGLGSFLKLRVGPWVVAQGDAGALKEAAVDVCLGRLARAEKLLLSSAAAVLAG